MSYCANVHCANVQWTNVQCAHVHRANAQWANVQWVNVQYAPAQWVSSVKCISECPESNILQFKLTCMYVKQLRVPGQNHKCYWHQHKPLTSLYCSLVLSLQNVSWPRKNNKVIKHDSFGSVWSNELKAMGLPEN